MTLPNALHTAWMRVQNEHLLEDPPILSPYHVLRFCPVVACIVPGRLTAWNSYVACPPPEPPEIQPIPPGPYVDPRQRGAT